MKPTFLILIFFFFHNTIYSSKCVSFKPTIDSAWVDNDQIFIGKVIGYDTSRIIYGSFGQPVTTFALEIIESFKDSVYSHFNKRTIFNFGEYGNSCDYSYFEKDSIYLFYARSQTFGFLRIGICGRSDKLSNINIQELEKLRYLKKLMFKEASQRINQQLPPPPPPSMKAEIIIRKEMQTIIRKNNFYFNTIVVLSILSGVLIILTIFLLIKLKIRK